MFSVVIFLGILTFAGVAEGYAEMKSAVKYFCGLGFIILSSVTLILCLQTASARADLEILYREDRAIVLRVSGLITESDANALDKLSADLQRDGYFKVSLDSEGGDVFAAMRIGRLIRKYDGTTEIEGKCYSSCALIFISGVLRLSIGELGLHRPYLASAPQSRETIEMQIPLMLSLIRRYVAEMGITDDFYQKIVNTEPSQMLIFTSEDYTGLVPEMDPVYQEVQTSYAARRYGVNTVEMRQRERDARECLINPKLLGSSPDVTDRSKRELEKSGHEWSCFEAVLWGLSEPDFLARAQKARECLRDDDDLKFLLSLPERERRDHPLWIKREQCERNIMLQP